MNKLIALFFSSLFLGVCARRAIPTVETAKPFSPYPAYPCETCWEKCFSKPPQDSLAIAYAKLYQYFIRVRSDRILSGAQSSVLLEDISIDFPRVFLQKNLMKLAAFALNSGPKCHPTALGGYGRFGSFLWVAVNGQCPTACDMGNLIDQLPTFPVGLPNPLGLSCLVADPVMSNTIFDCNFAQQRYALAFTNDPPQSFSSLCPPLFPVRLEVATRDPITFPPAPYAPTFTTTGPPVSFSYSSTLLQASNFLLKCIKETCCNNNYWLEAKPSESLEMAKGRSEENRSVDLSRGTIFYVDANDPKEVKQTEGNLKEFLTQKEEEADPCVVIPSEDGETNEGCMGDLCENPTYAEQCPQNCARCERGRF